jgi:nitrous oxide reductase accessory protein NosL
MTGKTTISVFLMVVLATFVSQGWADPMAELPDGSKLDLATTCPVCGMKLEASLLGPAAIVLKDGSVKGFDAAGDLFRFMFDPKKYSFDANNVKNICVTEYGTKKFIDGKTAFYVVGTDLQQGMGAEVAPFANKEDAEKFKEQHKGTGVVEFAKVTADDLKSKKKMLKMQH